MTQKLWLLYGERCPALEPFQVTATCCFTPKHLGLEPHHTSAPHEPEAFADFCATMVRRYVGSGPTPELVGFLGETPDGAAGPRFGPPGRLNKFNFG